MLISSNEHSCNIIHAPARRLHQSNMIVVRLYDLKSAPQQGNFFFPYSLVRGKTPEALKRLLSLTYIPTHMSVVNAQSNETLLPCSMTDADGREIVVLYSTDSIGNSDGQALWSEMPVKLNGNLLKLNGLHFLLNYDTQCDELFLRIYDKAKQEPRGEWVYSFKYAAGKSDEEIGKTFSFLRFERLAACNVVVPKGSNVNCWARDTSDNIYMYQLDLNSRIEFIDDRDLTLAIETSPPSL